MRALVGTAKTFRCLEVGSVIAFPIAWLTLLARMWTSPAAPDLVESMKRALLALVIGIAISDFISGIFHWFFDTWFSPDTPFIGRAFVRTFREHHVDPTAICRHDFVETNGSNMLSGCVLVACGHLQSTALGSAAFLVAGLFMSMTSQIHKWAHSERVPRWVEILQSSRLILSKHAHALHHAPPYDREYCITAGWLNAPLHHVRLFRLLEWAISSVTAAPPRRDDHGGTT